MKSASLAIGFLLPLVTASQGACPKPEPPACALARVPFESELAADNCRKSLLTFRDQMDKYASCLGTESADGEQAARAEYEDVRVRFNKRAREEFD